MFTCEHNPEECCCPAGYTYYEEKAAGQAEHSECTGTDIEGTF